MKRGGPLKRTGRLAPVSAKRKALAPDRDAVRGEVLRRAGDACQYAVILPEVRCAFYPPRRARLEVDELRGGSYRSVEWLDPDSCRATCPAHHDYKTNHKRETLRRLAEHEGAP